MRSFDRFRAHPWLLAMIVVALLGAHGLGFYLFLHLALSATLASSLIIFIAVKHLGLLGSALSMFRKRFVWRERRDSNPRPPA